VSICEPFYGGANTKTIRVHGIGLSMIKGIVKLHSGTLQIISEKEKVHWCPIIFRWRRSIFDAVIGAGTFTNFVLSAKNAELVRLMEEGMLMHFFCGFCVHLFCAFCA
jgi:signal transduction histidine kinase